MRILPLLSLCLSVSLFPVAAQSGGPGGGMGGMDLSFVKLFGAHTAFSARTEVSVTDGSAKEVMSMTATTALLDGKMRTDVDMANMKGAMIPPAALAQMKQMGMDRTVSIMRPDKKLAYVIYPSLKCYASIAIPEATAKALKEDAKIVKTELGKETVDGHPCVKNKVTLADEDGKSHEFTLWNATDLKDFPVKFQTTENGQVVTSFYKDVQFAKPEAKQFEPPADYKGYADIQEMQMALMKKMMGDMPKEP